MSKTGNSNLRDSSRNKQDEFYTNLQLIEDELKHYRPHFNGKRVLCNCDDPWESNFFKYFAMSFNSLGLKSLTATCYAASPFAQMELDLFGEEVATAEAPSQRKKQPYKIVINEVTDVNGDGRIDLADVEWLIKNREIFPLIRDNKVWLGIQAGHFWFKVPDSYEEKATDFKIDENGQKWRRMGNICWFTNLAQYTGKWLYDAKKRFSKTGCAAAAIGDKLLNGSAIRQDFLETALEWVADRDGGDILDYMSAHQHDENCDDLWNYFESVINWVKATFPFLRGKLMKGLPWGVYFNKYGKTERDGAALEKRIVQLLRDDEDVEDITNQRGIYEYLLSGDERHLSIRRFSDKMARTAYERQNGVCPICGKHFAIEEMQADHIRPWSKGGHTVATNCQMLCSDCNRRKGAKGTHSML